MPLAVIATVAPALPAPAAAPDGPAARRLYLEVFINGYDAGYIVRFDETAGRHYLADAQELRNVGIAPPPGHAGDIALDAIPGLSYRIDEAGQNIFFSAHGDSREARVFDADPAPDAPETAAMDEAFGLVANYDLDLQYNTEAAPLSVAAVDGRFFTPFGTLNHSFTASVTDVADMRHRRLATFWRTPMAQRAVQLQFGDMITRGPAWANPVRLGGAQVERNFALRPDLVTFPLPSFEGSAAVPSTVEVYADSVQLYATDVPEGPFVLDDIPLSTGSDNATIVLKDTEGREIVTQLPFLVTADLLRAGLADYSASLGYPRISFGADDDHYQATLFGAGTLRYGISDDLTLQGHAEGGGGLAMAGLGATVRVGSFGTVSANAAASSSGFGNGALADLSGQIDFGRFESGRGHVGARLLRRSDDFADIARVSARPSPGDDDAPYAALRALNQISVNIPVGERWNGVSLFYARSDRIGAGATDSLGFFASRRFGVGSSLNFSVMQARSDGEADLLMALGLHVPLGRRRYGTARVGYDDGEMRYAVGASRSEDRGRQPMRWRLAAIRDFESRLTGTLGRRFQIADVEIGSQVTPARQNAGLRAKGAVVVAGGGIFASNRIDDAFAVVDVGVPDVEVAFENRPAGRTGQSGKLLVTGLRSYQENAIAIDPAALPVAATVPRTREIAVPRYRSGVTLAFDVDPDPANAIAYLVDADGVPLPVGLNAELEATGDRYLIGYDGMVYLQGLSAENAVTVRWPDGRACRAEVPFRRAPGAIASAGKVPCL